jgi:GNAT superfamily N-acetyltransferase
MAGHVRLTITSDGDAGAIVGDLVKSFAKTEGAQPSEIEPLTEAVRGVLAFVSEAVYPKTPGELELTLELEKRALRVQLRDWGRPLKTAGGEFGAIPAQLADAAGNAVDLRIVNLGRDGKLTSFSWPLELPEPAQASAHALGAAAATEAIATDGTSASAVELREATADDAEGISRLLYDHYSLGYVHSDFYRPRWVAEQLDAGALRSTVALARGDVIGHHALLISAGEAWAESGVAVVHPAYRGLGVFGRMMKRTIATASDLRLAAICGEAVTIHPYSQRAEHAFGYRATALRLGSQLAPAPDATRHAQLLSYLMLSQPSRSVRMPDRYRQPLEDAYANVGLEAVAPPSVAARDPSVTWRQNTERRTAHIRIVGWDGERFTHGLREMLASHVDVLFANVDLAVTDELDAVVDQLNRHGFFYAGLRPCALDGHDALCVQRLNSRNIELEQIVCDSPFARRLLAYVTEDRGRVERTAA